VFLRRVELVVVSEYFTNLIKGSALDDIELLDQWLELFPLLWPKLAAVEDRIRHVGGRGDCGGQLDRERLDLELGSGTGGRPARHHGAADTLAFVT
jgi:hypothetical protein